MSERNIQESLRILHDTQTLVPNYFWKVSSLKEPCFLEYMGNIQIEMCNIKGNFISFIFYRNNLVELNECLHQEYLNNNEDILNLQIQNEQRLERLQDTCSSSHVSDCNMVDCLEDSHDMRDHEKHGKLQVLDLFEYELDEIQSLVVVEEELELPLEEVHDSTTLEPTHKNFFAFLREVHTPTPMDPSHDENFALSGHLGELVLYPTSYTSKFCSIRPNEVWVKGFFFYGAT